MDSLKLTILLASDYQCQEHRRQYGINKDSRQKKWQKFKSAKFNSIFISHLHCNVPGKYNTYTIKLFFYSRYRFTLTLVHF